MKDHFANADADTDTNVNMSNSTLRNTGSIALVEFSIAFMLDIMHNFWPKFTSTQINNLRPKILLGDAI